MAFPFRLLISSLAIVISLGLLTYDFTALNREWTSPPKPFVALQPDIATTYKHFVQPSATTINSLASVQAVTIDPCANQVIESKIGAPVNGTHVLVTGGAGFIGSTLTDRLLKLGYKVRIFDNLATGSLRNVPLGNDHLEFVLGDIMNQKDVYNAMDGIDYVFHLAAMSKVVPSLKSPAMAKFCTEVNALGTWNVLESARLRKVKKVIYAASSTFYGGNPLPNTETDAPDFLTPYAASKYEGELQMQTFNNVFNLPTISLRFFMVYGPRQPSTGAYAIVTGVFAKQAGLGEPLTIEGTGNHSRDFIHVDDIAEGLIIAQQSSLSGQVINLGTGVGYSVQQVADLVSKNQVHVSERKNDLNATLADTCKMKNVLGFQPKKDFVVEMSRVAKETMGGSVFAQTWVDKDVIVAVPWLLPARSKAVPWFGKDANIQILLESVFGAAPSNPFISLVFLPNITDIKQKALFLNHIYSLVAIGKSRYYVVGTTNATHQECLNLNLPCWNVQLVVSDFECENGLSRLQAAKVILTKGIDVHVGSITTSYVREIQVSYEKFHGVDVIMSDSLGSDSNYVLVSNARTIRLIDSLLETAPNLPEMHLLDYKSKFVTDCTLDGSCKEIVNENSQARLMKFHHPTACVIHAEACEAGSLYSTACLDSSNSMEVDPKIHIDAMYLTQCPTFLDVCDIQQIVPKIWIKGQLNPIKCSSNPALSNLRNIKPQKGYLSEPALKSWSRGAIKKILSIHELLEESKSTTILTDSESNTISYGFPNGFNTRNETLFLITGTVKRGGDDWRADRAAFIGRHIAQIKRQEKENEIQCAYRKKCRQMLWIIAEDSNVIDPVVTRLLKCSQIPFVYFSYGPTHLYGNAQKNALLQFVVEMTRSFNFHGNIHPLDDDGYALAEGFELSYGIRKWGLLPNTGLGPEGMEYAAIENGKVVMHAGWAERKYPFDYNMLIFNSNIFDKLDPMTNLFWPYPGGGGESEFADIHLTSLQEVEVPCHKCQYLFYNTMIAPDQMIHKC